MEKHDSPLALFAVFAPLSLIAVGGGLSILGDIQRITVTNGWMSAQEFTEMFALSRVAPGPSTLIVSLIGWHVAGLAGCLTASLAIFAPSGLLTYAMVRVMHRYRSRFWPKAIARGLAPVATALILAATVRLLQHASDVLLSWCIALLTAIVAARTKVGLVALLAAGAALFVAVTNVRLFLLG